MVSIRDVLHLQADLADRLTGGNTAKLVNSLARIQESTPSWRSVAATLATHVRQARAFHVEANMTAVIANRAANLERIPVESRLGVDHQPPRMCGFVILEDPIELPEMRNRWQWVNAITWGPVTLQDAGTRRQRYGWAVTLWNDIVRQPDELSLQSMREAREAGFDPLVTMGRWNPIATMFMKHGDIVGKVWVQITDELRAEAEMNYPGAPPVSRTEIPNPGRPVVALWQLLSEETRGIERRVEAPDRASRRQAQRARIEPDVTVVTLRREAQQVQHPGTGRPLDHQVPVCEHWRTYWIKDEETGQRRPERRKIAAHVRGPEGTPLVVRPKIENLAR